MCVQSASTIVTSPSDAPSANPSVTPSPISTPSSPAKATLYAQLDSSLQPKSIAITSPQVQQQQQQQLQHQQLQQQYSQTRVKKMRHRRVGSGTLVSPKASPHRDRRIQSEPTERTVKLVDTTTQTDAMDISEAEVSPNHYLASRQITICLGEDEGTKKKTFRFIENSAAKGKIDNNPNVVAASAMPVLDNADKAEKLELDEDCVDNFHQPEINDNMLSPNNNSAMTSSGELTNYRDACSSPDLIDEEDVMNSNERLDIRDCSDDDNLNNLGRKVTEFINENCFNTNLENNCNNNINNDNHMNNSNGDSYKKYSNNSLTSNNNSMCNNNSNSNLNKKQQPQQQRGFVSVNDNDVLNNKNNSNMDNHRQHFRRRHADDDDEFCDDSWTDEEGDPSDPIDYNYSWRRKRYVMFLTSAILSN